MALRTAERRRRIAAGPWPSPHWGKAGQAGAPPRRWGHLGATPLGYRGRVSSPRVGVPPPGPRGPRVERGLSFLVWPTYLISRLLGLLPLRYWPRAYSTQTNWLSLSPPWLPMSTGLVVGTAYASYLETDRFIKVIVNPKTTLSNYIYQVPMLFSTVVGVTCAAYSLYGARTLAASWRNALATLAELDAVNRTASSTSRRCQPIESWVFFALIWFNLAVMVATHVLYMSNHEYVSSPWDSAAVLFARLVPMTVESQYLLSCMMLQRAYCGLTLCFRSLSRGFFPSDQPEPLLPDGSLGLAGAMGYAGYALRAGGQGGPPLAGVPVGVPWGPSKAAWGPAAAGPGLFASQATRVGPAAPGTPNGAPAQPGPRHEMLSWLRVIHQRVFQQVEEMTAHFGPQLLCKLLQTRIQLITDAFALVKQLQETDDQDKPTYVAYFAIEVCFLVYRLFVVVYRSEKVLQQDQVLVQLVCLVDPTSWDNASNQQLQLFRRQVRALRAELHTCNMFTLNYDLLLAVAATTTTYLVVLVQFQPKSTDCPSCA